jgi:hypothetical protein
VHFKLLLQEKSATDSLSIPSNALLFRAKGLWVGVVRNGVAQVIPITIGRDCGSAVEVIRGLLPTDNVILDPSDSFISGTVIRIAAHLSGASNR